ncbi:hypothetical protein FHR95_001157 [Halomonas fontilapidosi]|uniref:Uncharacterized protein n=1 Tax=Halomonas fontilapidosi TaxID=616675 RepID=A0A7W5DJ85_9GAMM|nr:hypothetical protein [Halomonas fontilapidosi]
MSLDENRICRRRAFNIRGIVKSARESDKQDITRRPTLYRCPELDRDFMSRRPGPAL